MRSRAIHAALILGWLPVATCAALDVNPPRQITRRVTVQLIQTAHDDGTPATVFGNASQRAEVEAGIDTIWAQAGIDVLFLPNVTRYEDTFAYQGNAGTGKRPQSDLSTIGNNARREGGVLNPDSSVLNLFMVNIVPAFNPLGEGSAAGLAWIAGNGIAAFVGDNLLTRPEWREVIAGVIAHEIGHNLGLDHTSGTNLMSSGSNSQKLISSQINTVFTATSFVKPLPVVVLPGDYDGDGVVDATDYTIWRNTMNQTGTSLAADGNKNGRVDQEDYAIWKTNFGRTGGAGSVFEPPAAAAPEPTALLLAFVAAAALISMRRRRS
jgi:hypothetical protein